MSGASAMNLPPSRHFDAMPHQLGLSVQQEAGRQLVRRDEGQVQKAANLLDAYRSELNRAGGTAARENLLANMVNAGLASQSTDLGVAAMKYAGLA